MRIVNYRDYLDFLAPIQADGLKAYVAATQDVIDKYNSIISKDKIFNDTDYSVSDNRRDTGTSSGSTSAKNKFSDTPQGGLTGLENDRYLTRAEINSGTAENNSNSTSELNRHVTGKSGGKSYAEMSMEYREAIINIEEEIINDCSDLFMMIY